MTDLDRRLADDLDGDLAFRREVGVSLRQLLPKSELDNSVTSCA